MANAFAPKVNSLSPGNALAGQQPELRAWNPGVMDNVRNFAMNALAPLFGGDVRAANAYYRDKVQPTLEFLPGVGDVMAAGEARDAFGQGDYLGGGLLAAGAAAGLVPGVGDAVQKGASKAVKRARENLHNVGNSNFNFYRLQGEQDVPLANLKGGVALDDPQQMVRIDDLVQKIDGPDGYIERLIVDQNGNVIEGQHRLEALRKLGYNSVPVHVIEDLDDVGINVSNALEDSGIYRDHAYQLTNYAMEDVINHGERVLTEEFGYDNPKLNAAYKSAARMVLDAINTQKSGAGVVDAARAVGSRSPAPHGQN
jgi:hypothetical protein